MTINERIKFLMATYSLNKNQLALKLEVSPTVIGNIVGRRYSNPSYELLEKLLTQFPDISAEWLMRDVGSIKCQQKASSNDIINTTRQECSECTKKDKMIDRLERENERLLKFIDRLEGQNQTKVANCG